MLKLPIELYQRIWFKNSMACARVGKLRSYMTSKYTFDLLRESKNDQRNYSVTYTYDENDVSFKFLMQV